MLKIETDLAFTRESDYGTVVEQALTIIFQYGLMGKTRDTRYDPPQVNVVAFKKTAFDPCDPCIPHCGRGVDHLALSQHLQAV